MTSVAEIATIMSDVASASKEQETGLQEVNGAISQMDEMTQQNAAMVEETTASARTLSGKALTLVELISFFRAEGLDAPSETIASSANTNTGGEAIEPPAARLPHAAPPTTPSSQESDGDDGWDEF